MNKVSNPSGGRRPLFLSSYHPDIPHPLNYIQAVATAYDSVDTGTDSVVAGLSSSGFCAGWKDGLRTITDKSSAEKPALGHALEFVNSFAYTHLNVHCWADISGTGPCESILRFTRACAEPFILTPHHLQSRPAPRVRQNVCELTSRASCVVAKAPCDEHILRRVYAVPKEKLLTFPHRLPRHEVGRGAGQDQPSLPDGTPVILALDLPEKGSRMDVAIDALARIVGEYPEAVQIVLETPSSAYSGRPGRPSWNELRAQAERRGVAGHLQCVERPVSLSEFRTYLRAADVCLTPFERENRGAARDLAYVLSSGNVLLSTPYTSAAIVSCAGAALLDNFDSAHRVAERVTSILQSPDRMEALQKNSAKMGRELLDTEMGEGYYRTFVSVPWPQADRRPLRNRGARAPSPD